MKWLWILVLASCGRAQVLLEAPARENSATDSLSAYTEFVYPLVRENCASCHAQSQAPTFAGSNAKDSHDLLIETSKVDFQDPTRSRLYLRLAADSHNCFFGGDCNRSSQKMLEGIREWAKFALVQPDVSVVTQDWLVPQGVNATTATPVSFELRTFLNTTQNVNLTGELKIFDPDTYILSNLRLKVILAGVPNENSAHAVRVKGVQFLVNSRVDPTANTFSLFDEVIMADVGGAGLSRNYLSIPPVLIPIQQGPGTDRLALGFESLHLAPRVQVVLNMIRTHCFECHAGTQPARINLSAGIDEASLINILRDYDGAGARPPWPLVIPLQPSRSPLSLALSGTSAAQRSLPASTNPTYGAATVSVSRMTPDSAAFMLGVPAGDRNRYRDEMKRIVDYWIFNLGKP